MVAERDVMYHERVLGINFGEPDMVPAIEDAEAKPAYRSFMGRGSLDDEIDYFSSNEASGVKVYDCEGTALYVQELPDDVRVIDRAEAMRLVDDYRSMVDMVGHGTVDSLHAATRIAQEYFPQHVGSIVDALCSAYTSERLENLISDGSLESLDAAVAHAKIYVQERVTEAEDAREQQVFALEDDDQFWMAASGGYHDRAVRGYEPDPAPDFDPATDL
ncbi:TPA: hypothetical protein HA265_04195 [Candidatus Woesearchaeota archaeon]|nr:hypothetical protein [Candidatus Woesearchaeota archaeon]